MKETLTTVLGANDKLLIYFSTQEGVNENLTHYGLWEIQKYDQNSVNVENTPLEILEKPNHNEKSTSRLIYAE